MKKPAIKNEVEKQRRLKRWRMLAAFSSAVIVICLILLLWMGEL